LVKDFVIDLLRVMFLIRTRSPNCDTPQMMPLNASSLSPLKGRTCPPSKGDDQMRIAFDLGDGPD